MTTVNWTISTLDREVSNGFVNCAHWQATAVDGEYSASTYATCSWADGTPVIPYENLTQETVLGWVWETVPKQATEDALSAQIALQKNPVTSTGVPWSQA
jgi:hypothetical protein